MSKKLTIEEKLMQFLISEYNKDNNSSNEISINATDIKDLGITENEASRTLLLLETSNYFTIKAKSVHNNFSRFWTVELNQFAIHYFDNQKESKIEKRRKSFEEFRAWATLLIAILAFGLSIYALYLQYMPTT